MSVAKIYHRLNQNKLYKSRRASKAYRKGQLKTQLSSELADVNARIDKVCENAEELSND